jgi:hypothetical protein
VVHHRVDVGDDTMLLGYLDRLEELVLGAPLGALSSLLVELAEIPDVIAAGSSGDR